MKTKDNVLKGIIIGISVIVLPLILMGTTNLNTENEVGTFQVELGVGENNIYETTYDTRTGKVIKRTRLGRFDFIKD